MSGINLTGLSFKAEPQINATQVPMENDTLAPLTADIAGMPQSLSKDTVNISQPQTGTSVAPIQSEEPQKGTSWLKIGAAVLGVTAAMMALHSLKPSWFGRFKNLGTSLNNKLTGHEILQKIVSWPTRLFNWVEGKGKTGGSWIKEKGSGLWKSLKEKVRRGEKKSDSVTKETNADTTKSDAVITNPPADTATKSDAVAPPSQEPTA